MKFVTSACLLTLSLLLLTANQLQAGDKMLMIYRNTEKVKMGTLLVTPMIPDPYVVEKLSENGGEAKLAIYYSRLEQANLNLKSALEELFDFCPIIFLDSVPEMKSFDTYYEHLATYDKSNHYVLQFGNTQQFKTDPYTRIREYDRNVLGIYSADGKRQLLIFPGVPKHCWKDEYARGRIVEMQSMLVKYYLKGQKKGLIKAGG